MPLSAAERQRRRRQKLKDDGNYEKYKQKNNLEAKKSRKKKEENISKLAKSKQVKIRKEIRKNVRERVAKYRALKNVKVSVETNASTSAYKTASALGKATARAKRCLPTTPRRKKAVIKRLLETEIDSSLDSDKESTSAPVKIRSSGLTFTIVRQVKDFYEEDDISQQAPGRKDVVSIRQEDGTKLKLQARHMILSIKEAYRLFQVQYPDLKLGKSKFAALRPKHVLLSSKLPHNVCLCKYHENFISAVNDLHKYVPTIPLYTSEFPEKLLCKENTRQCWMNECNDCKDGKGFRKLFIEEIHFEETATWHIWKKVENERIYKVVEEGTIDDLIQYLQGLVPQFVEHCFIKRHQAKEYRKQRERASSDYFKQEVCMIQVDFSENYKCVSQDEIQSAHWSQGQISLFTVAMWHSGILHSKIIASDDLAHAKQTVLPYIAKLLEDLPSIIKEVRIWSDGPNSQFKNKFIAATLPVLEEKYAVKIKWNFFASSHGKGPVDGIGGSVKRQVWNAVKKRQFTVYNAREFVVAASATSNVEVIEMTTLDINSLYLDLNLERVFKSAPTFDSIMRCHVFEVVNGKTYGNVVTETNPSDQCTNLIASIGDWFQVKYDEELYPGEIKDKVGQDYLVSVMVRAGSYWKWPNQQDEIFYPEDCLVKKLDPPIVVSARGHFQFNDI